MPNVGTLCLVCNKTFQSDHNYLVHMETVHGTVHPDEAMNVNRAVQQNTPKQGAVVIGEGIPPSPEMVAVMEQAEQEMAQMQANTPTEEPIGAKGMSDADIQKLRDMGLPDQVPETKPIPKNSPPAPEVKAEPEPIILNYQYSGDCKKCKTPVDTLIVKAKGELFAIAFCPKDRKQVKSIKVEPIDNGDLKEDMVKSEEKDK